MTDPTIMKYLPTLETERLIIRPITRDDVQAFYEMDSQSEVHIYLRGQPVQSIEETKGIIEGLHQQYEQYGVGRVAVIEKATNQFIGWTGFKYIDELTNNKINFLDFGYRFRKEAWGKGFATEAAQACMAYYHEEMKHFPIHAMTHIDNKGSRNVLEKVGFNVTDSFHLAVWDIDCYWYEINA
ncbi:GNAT family N-acetyltransferase [Sphingobacterium sp. SRCM116780]|uniref:GNAT family N-acetyltransferase n=1 Tax=Sphingobacterium sp. SRCM116780 TaxID=2907623 RepID=UPI001F3CEB4C|nr:GNAT family N-acetyltransferase [Sphingobacterium sp. SRCM116780]UIR56586.1 GNAT family N-acetyltransferase [Sphingobacterium sp. SRCM116780]